jgi:cytoskeletal protein RodZ
MLSRNLPLYQSSSDCPDAGHWAKPGAEAPTFGGGAFTELRRRRRREGTLFWMLVAAIAITVGALTWFALPVQRKPASPAPAAASPNVVAAPDRQRPQLPSDGLTTAAANGRSTTV